MKNIIGLAVIPLFCIGVTILTALVILFALRRGTRTINEKAEQVISDRSSTTSANTRWARGDMQGETSTGNQPPAMRTCPACGGENPANSSSCAYCGRKL